MDKRALALAIILGLVIPWILFSSREATYKGETTDETIGSTEECVEKRDIMIPVKFDNGVIRDLPLEAYVIGVIIGEMPASFSSAALQAQAVVARTFALKCLRNGSKHTDAAVCTDSSCCQNYISIEAYERKHGDPTAFENAVQATEGLVLVYNDELIEATYYSCSGGRTEDAMAVWGTDIPYLRAMDSPGEEQSQHYLETKTYSVKEIRALLGVNLSDKPGEWIGNVTYTNGGGVDKIQIGNITYSGMEIRKKLGLKSTAFVISAVGDSIVITTKGYGHRVGMSQYGADAMAVKGANFTQILAYYYPGTQLLCADNV